MSIVDKVKVNVWWHGGIDGFWRARVTYGDTTLDADCRHGSWQTTLTDGRHDVMPEFAALLQRHVNQEKRREKRRIQATQR